FKKAIALEKPDKTPMQFNGDAFCANHMGVKLSEIAVNTELCITTIINSVNELGDIDVVDYGATYAPAVGMYNLSNTKVPGRQLPEDSLWQVDETGTMTEEDYDTILDKGFEAFFNDFTANRLNIDFQEMEEQMGKAAEAPKRYAEAGYVNSSTIAPGGEVDYLSGGRTMAKFARDLYRMPDKVYAALDIIHEYNINSLKQQLKNGNAVTGMIAAGRGACDFYSPKIWERVIWKYYKNLADLLIENGVTVQWHMDGNYERGLSYFRDFEKGTCLFCPDGQTDIYKVKEVLGDISCIRGDVPAPLLVLGTPEDVHNYASRLIRDMGPGFVMGVACCTPPNAKVENVKAMIAAASGK
ncbi:MAG: uroporphyrinogen-III decarboxylase, partial [Eubacteriales bacterium]|nr:uroporphyrinogen-III decarboxylase [Eubacteriales bacterium]